MAIIRFFVWFYFWAVCFLFAALMGTLIVGMIGQF